MKRIKTVLLSLMVGVGFLTGCGQTEMVDLSEEQQMQVAEYAAGLLLKHANNYHSRLVDSEKELIALADERAYKEELKAKVDAMKQTDASEEELVSDSTDSQNVDAGDSSGETVTNISMEEILNILPVSVSYTGFEMRTSYPDADEGAFVFAMDATEGNQLLVMHFAMTNGTAETVEMDTASLGCRFLCRVNEEGYRNVLTTMLLNDLASYKGTIEAGTSQDVVLVLEVPENTQVQNLELMIKKDSQQVKIPLE